MDKFEYKVKIDEIKSLIGQRAYEDAVDVADTIDWSGVKNVRDLCLASDLYKKNRLFEESRKILLYAYKKQKARPIVKSLCELSIELGDLVGAMAYRNEFDEMAPKDPGRFILQYKIYKAQNISIEEQIEVLEQLVAEERMGEGKWEYELATLYHKAGMEAKCIEECEQIILWHVDGKYVMKAYELKALHQPLTEQENYKYEVLRHAGGELNIQYSLKDDGKPNVPDKGELEVKGVDVSPYNTQNLQAVVAEGLQSYLDGKTNVIPSEKVSSYEEAVAMDEEALGENVIASEPEVNPELMVTTVYNAVLPEKAVGQELEENDRNIAQPSRHSDTDIIGEAAKEMASGKLKENVPFIKQDTDEIVPITGTEDIKNTNDFKIPQTKYFKPDINSTGIIETFRKGSHMDEILSQEYDGQIGFVLPEENPVEKQITGQISIDDVMKDWKKKKEENEQKRIADVKAQVRKQANGLLDNFDEATKSDLLEQIESAMITAALKEEQEKNRASRPKEIKVADISGISEEKKVQTKVSAPEPATQEDREAFNRSVEAPNNDDDFTPLAKTVPHEEIPQEEIITEKSTPSEDAVTENTVTDSALDKEIPTQEPEDNKAPAKEEALQEKIKEQEDRPEHTEKEQASEQTAQTKIKEEKPANEEPKDHKENVNNETRKAQSRPTGSAPGKIRALTDSEKEQFAAFIHHKSTRRQLANTLDNVTLASYTGNVLVTSEEDNEITTFSKLLVREIQMADANFTGKVAKVSGDNLNRKDIDDTLKCVSNGALIISEAEGLKKKTVETLLYELGHTDRGVVVVMQGHADIIDKIVEKNEGMAEAFNLRIDLKAFDNKTLVEYAKSYAYDNEYRIDDLGVLALHTRIADMQTSDHEVTLSEIEEIVDEAIYYANKKTPAHFFDILFGKRYGEEDMIVLREKDFMHY